jgi:hypothetical protein
VSSIEEIQKLEERMRQAELLPDPQYFQDVIADDALLDRYTRMLWFE